VREAPIRQAPARPPRKVRAFWMKQLHTWHWISAALALVGMLLFAITGLTLNHASAIDAKPVVTHPGATLPPSLLHLLGGKHAADAPLPDAVATDLKSTIGLDVHGKAGEWSDDEVYVALPRPGGDAWLSIDKATGKVTSEITDRGWISYLNDLHKGRNAGAVWFWFIDLFAVACIAFTLTGLILLQLHARHRPLTWPLVGLGLLIPIIIAILFIH
jgi:hypothetical protein